MTILNYTTKVSAEKTVGELQQLLGRAGARHVLIEFDLLSLDGKPATAMPVAVTFTVPLREQVLHFKLPCRWQGVRGVLRRAQVERKYKTDAHALRVAWRIVKDWVEAQLALIKSEQAELAEVFLPYSVDESGKTVYERFQAGRQLAPPASE